MVGINVRVTAAAIKLNQSHYIRQIAETFKQLKAAPALSPASPHGCLGPSPADGGDPLDTSVFPYLSLVHLIGKHAHMWAHIRACSYVSIIYEQNEKKISQKCVRIWSYTVGMWSSSLIKCEHSHVHMWVLAMLTYEHWTCSYMIICEHSYTNKHDAHMWALIYEQTFGSYTNIFGAIKKVFVYECSHVSMLTCEHSYTSTHIRTQCNAHMWVLICEHSYVSTHMWTIYMTTHMLALICELPIWLLIC